MSDLVKSNNSNSKPAKPKSRKQVKASASEIDRSTATAGDRHLEESARDLAAAQGNAMRRAYMGEHARQMSQFGEFVRETQALTAGELDAYIDLNYPASE